MEPVWTKSEKATSNCVDKSVAQYTGGIITTEKDLSSTSLGLAEGQMFPELAHLVIGLEGVSHQVCIDIPKTATSCYIYLLDGQSSITNH